ncbi:PAS domain S-box protein [Methanogenium marinum]|uniref:PAS domain S-box protein n=1 Tax=Methanogenium marinum TaxID=348610 RepID=A0A9Q4KPU2_9EURY|nr:PAS domain S-box protein [Methanogenium marinum]MDE4908343.1 PAS domain S-box protein [Methanogenium marinum]
MNMAEIGQDSQRAMELIVISSLTVLSFVVVSAGLMMGVTILLAHLFYIPIVLEAYWFRRKVPLFALSVGIIYILLVAGFGSTTLVILTAGGRAVLFVAISVLVSYLSGHLHDEEHRFSCLVDSVSDPLIWMTAGGTVAYVNEAYCTLTGTTHEAITGKSYIPLFFSNGATGMEEFLSSLSPAHPTGMIESVIATGEGDEHVIQWNVHTHYKRDGTISGSITIGRDITALRKTETALTENVETLKAVFSNARECLIIGTCDKNGMPDRIWDVNRYGCAIFGYSLAEMQSHRVKGLFPDSLSYLSTAMEAGQVGITDGHIEVRARGKDGARFPVEVAVSSYEMHGETRFVLAMRDITAWVTAQKTLTESERRFHDFADFLPLPAFEVEYDGGIMFRNLTADTLFGYGEVDWMEGLAIFALIPSGEQPEMREMFQVCLVKDTILSSEFSCVRQDGSQFPAMIYCRRMMEKGIVTGLRVLVADLTEQRGVEQALNRSETMYRTVFENTGTGMFLLNADGTIVNTNRTGADLAGYPLGTLISGNLSFADLVTGDDRIGFRENAVQMFAGAVPPRTLPSVGLVDAGGMVHDTSITLSFIPDSYQLAVSITDETGKNQSERLIAVSNGIIQLIIYEDDTTHLLSAACAEFGRLDQYYVVSISLCMDNELNVSGVSSMAFLETNAAFISTSPAPSEAIASKMVSYSPWTVGDVEAGTAEEIDVFVLPMVAGDQVEGVLSVYIRSSATVTEQELTTLQALANDIAYGIQSRCLEEEKVEALSQIERNMEDLSILNDHIRNPLQVILGLAENGDEAHCDIMAAQVQEIDSIVRRLDQRCLESEKIRDFLRKHYHFESKDK